MSVELFSAATAIRGVRYDTAGFGDLFWGNRRIRFIHTPGHGLNAVSVIADVNGMQIVFCGEAAHSGATIWQPYHLEWDHWSGTGALAAWEGVRRLANLGMELLCPSHGPVIRERPREMSKQLAEKLLEFYHAKGNICASERDRYLIPHFLRCGARRILYRFIQFGANSYLLLSDSGEALVIDPYSEDIAQLEPLLRELGKPRVTAAFATQDHCDHSDGLPVAQAP